MLAKLVVEGKEFDIEILDPKLQELIAPKKNTGYEPCNLHEMYFFERSDGEIDEQIYNMRELDFKYYNSANCYSSIDVAKNNARADKLMRQLRRFAVEHRTKDNPTEKYYIHWMESVGLQIMRSTDRYIGPWFDTMHNAVQAIKTFQDDLMWYFTEYRDSL